MQIPVEQVDANTGDVIRTFSSHIQAAQALGIASGNILKCCKMFKHFYSSGGFKWRFAASDTNDTSDKEATAQQVEGSRKVKKTVKRAARDESDSESSDENTGEILSSSHSLLV
jgi:NUMOD1 domain